MENAISRWGLLGDERALLLDTGATEDAAHFPLRRVVDRLVQDWRDLHPHPSYGLVVAHSHAHGDHVAADRQFAGRPDTVVVGPDADAVRDFFGLAGWPEGSAEIDLGGRVVDVLPGPGHEEAGIVLYDRRTGLMLTGDKRLVEGNTWGDRFWGCVQETPGGVWVGRNELGRILMATRDKLQHEIPF